MFYWLERLRLPASTVAEGCGGQGQTCGYFKIYSKKSQKKGKEINYT